MEFTTRDVVPSNGLSSGYAPPPPAVAAVHNLTPDTAVAALAALGHGLRLDIWRMLAPLGPIGLSAGTISTRLAVAPSSLSFHLQQMIHGRILVQRRSSRQLIYAVNHEITAALSSFLLNAGGDLIRLAPEVLGADQSDDVANER